MGSASLLRGVRDGDVRDLEHPDHPLGGEDVIAARGQLRIVFNPRSELHVSGDVNHRDPTPLFYNKILAVKPGFQVDNPADLHEVRTSFPAEGETFQSGASARFTFNLTPSIQVTRGLEEDYRLPQRRGRTSVDRAAGRLQVRVGH